MLALRFPRGPLVPLQRITYIQREVVVILHIRIHVGPAVVHDVGPAEGLEVEGDALGQDVGAVHGL